MTKRPKRRKKRVEILTVPVLRNGKPWLMFKTEGGKPYAEVRSSVDGSRTYVVPYGREIVDTFMRTKSGRMIFQFKGVCCGGDGLVNATVDDLHAIMDNAEKNALNAKNEKPKTAEDVIRILNEMIEKRRAP